MFIVIELQTNSDGTVGNLVWAYASENEAYSKYHSVLSAAAISTLPCHACVVLRNDGQLIAAQAYHHIEEE